MSGFTIHAQKINWSLRSTLTALRKLYLSRFKFLNLLREVTKLYLNTGIFTDYVREKPETVIKKSK